MRSDYRGGNQERGNGGREMKETCLREEREEREGGRGNVKKHSLSHSTDRQTIQGEGMVYNQRWD